MKTERLNAQQNKGIAWVLFLIFSGLFVLVSACHEPWYDEALAWQIARSASMKDILLSVPHYEGHPPFWYLLLAVPARLGVPYELGLKTVAGIPVFVSVWLLLFRSPFPKAVKYLLPFHYFVFYQYGVISRPYSWFLLFFLLLAIVFPEKEKKPGRFVLLLGLLCTCSGYGIILAGGIAAVWLLDICQEKHWKIFTKTYWQDRRILSLMVLLVFALFVTAGILPRSDAYALNGREGNSIVIRLIYTIFMLLPDSTLMATLQGAEFLKYHAMNMGVLLIGVIAGLGMLAALWAAGGKKTWKYFWMPYTLFAVFSAAVYFCAHHIGIAFCFVLFWLWVVFEGGICENWQHIAEKEWFTKIQAGIQEKDLLLIKRTGIGLVFVILIVPIYWTLSASFRDVTEPYYYARGAAEFIKEHNLQNAKAFASWDMDSYHSGENQDRYEGMDTNLVSIPASIIPYFEHNFVLNFGDGSDTGAYVTHRVATPEENRKNLAAWAENDYPEFFLGGVSLELIYGEDAELPRYVPVYEFKPFYANIWKNYSSSANILGGSFLYLREDLLEEYGLTVLDRR